jgi:predicted nuclease with TOPRIM domain
METKQDPDSKETEATIEAHLRAWAAEIEQLKAKVDREVAEAKKGYFEQVDGLRRDVEAQLLKWSYELKELKSQAGQTDVRQAVRDLRGKLDEELKAWGPQIDLLKAKAAKAEAEAKRMMDEFVKKRDELKQELTGLKGSSEAAWSEMRTGVGKAWEELKTGLKSAGEKFK